MPAVSAIFLVAALILAVVIGPQTRPWAWGPAMLALGVAALAALPVIWKRGKAPADFGMLAFGTLTAGWFAWRAWISPVVELGHADMLLVGCAVATFLSIRAIAGNATAERILAWGIALLLLASIWVVGKQVPDPTFSPVFRQRAGEKMISGFAAHYNEAANYFIASSLLVAAAALFGRHATATRILWCLIAAAGLACVWFTRSRGGIIGAAVGCGVLAAVALMLAKRRNAKWFAPALISVPVIGLAVGAFWIMGWKDAQIARAGAASIETVQQKGNVIEGILDNDVRLYLLGIAISCIGTHPLSGGGSQSFSWENYRFFESHTQRHAGNRPDLVHNELLQAATDYGLVGAGLLVGLLGALALAAILRILFEDRPREPDSRDAWRLGALAALAGMLVQSCFSFVFHLIPGIMLLGICLGQMSRPREQSPGPQTLGSRILLTLAALACVALLLPAGWWGSQVTRILWSTYFSKQAETSEESRLDALAEALRIWPQSEFHQDRAAIFQQVAITQAGGPGFREPAELALADYTEAARLHPYEPSYPINRANLLSQLRRDTEAEAAYARAIELQGGMEPGFRGHFSLANHYLRKGLRAFDAEDPEPALASLELAAEEVETAVKQMHWVIADMHDPRVSIHESLGTAREAAADREGALECFNFAATLRGGTHAHYRAGVLIGSMAVEAWSKRRPAEAMALFIEARKRIGQAANNLPEGVTPSQRVEYTAYLDRSIAFLKGAKIEPAK
ncbi:MAG: O-antigen ligase family protein [Luteolibacter sp.]|jgi:tetratricopeptide (TPR) repeat protein|nr:O-antigen ligase family protein [Luteolibacter sp.]